MCVCQSLYLRKYFRQFFFWRKNRPRYRTTTYRRADICNFHWQKISKKKKFFMDFLWIFRTFFKVSGWIFRKFQKKNDFLKDFLRTWGLFFGIFLKSFQWIFLLNEFSTFICRSPPIKALLPWMIQWWLYLSSLGWYSRTFARVNLNATYWIHSEHCTSDGTMGYAPQTLNVT